MILLKEVKRIWCSSKQYYIALQENRRKKKSPLLNSLRILMLVQAWPAAKKFQHLKSIHHFGESKTKKNRLPFKNSIMSTIHFGNEEWLVCSHLSILKGNWMHISILNFKRLGATCTFGLDWEKMPLISYTTKARIPQGCISESKSLHSSETIAVSFLPPKSWENSRRANIEWHASHH